MEEEEVEEEEEEVAAVVVDVKRGETDVYLCYLHSLTFYSTVDYCTASEV